ncbi:unnamed protein product [Bemisia tabaci]|uniref:Uncharacterized protein n=1 Tax=Bemisia tabaci TaxID=7038 RepID=A0A9P0EZD6_BEMTA|nr:unnamed protein product [Bemisia tabaci]
MNTGRVRYFSDGKSPISSFAISASTLPNFMKIVSLCLFLATIRFSEAAKPGFITVRNNGTYVSYLELEFHENGETKSLKSEHFVKGQSKTIEIPQGATNIFLTVKCQMIPKYPDDVMSKFFIRPVQKCYEVWGSVADPRYAEIRSSCF